MIETLSDLRITPDEVENLTGLSVSDLSVGGAIRPIIFQQSKRFLAFVLTELLTLGVILIFCLPIGLLIARNLGELSTGVASAIKLLQVSFLVSIALLLLWNLYRWLKLKSLRLLVSLLDEVDKHNEIIDALEIVDQLSAIKNSQVSLGDREEVIGALNATRESLVCALMTEKILRKHQRFMARRHELFANIESNLATLRSLQVRDQASEYGQLLNEALQIGCSVHEELRRQSDESAS